MKIINIRLFLSFALVLIAPLLLGVRLLYLQVWQHNYIESLAERQINSKKVLPVSRGEIRDRNNRLLAINLEVDSVAVNPRIVKNKSRFAGTVAGILKVDQGSLARKLNTEKRFVWLQRQVSPRESEELKKTGLKELEFRKETKRYYPLSDLTSSLIGVVGVDGKGISGVELLYDDELIEKGLVETYKRDGLNRKVKVSQETEPVSVNVVLTIDTNLQYMARKALEKIFERYHPDKGFVVIQNPKTGEVLALTCMPSFDPNKEKFEAKDLLNPAINSSFEAGSVFKIVPAVAALSENLYDEKDLINCENGSYKLADIEINDHEKYRTLTFEGILAYSSNIGFAKVGQKLGKERLYEWTRRFGFGALSGSRVPGESRGILFPPNKWSGVRGPIMCYGHGISVTGLQLVDMFSSVANRGLLMEPQVVKSLVNSKGETIWSCKPKVVRRVADENTMTRVRCMMEKVVEYGTGKPAAVEGYRVAGKTGTAQKVDQVTKKYTQRYISSFCGFVPSEDPALTILIVIDEPKGGYYATEIACPAFSSIAKEAMAYLKIKENQQYVYNK